MVQLGSGRESDISEGNLPRSWRNWDIEANIDFVTLMVSLSWVSLGSSAGSVAAYHRSEVMLVKQVSVSPSDACVIKVAWGKEMVRRENKIFAGELTNNPSWSVVCQYGWEERKAG